MNATSQTALRRCMFEQDLIDAIGVQGGFESLVEIGEQTEEDLRRLVKRIAADSTLPYFPLIAENRLLGLRYLLKEKARFNETFTNSQVTLDKIKAIVKLRSEHELATKLVEEREPQKADAFLDPSKWRTYESKLRDVLPETFGGMHHYIID